MTNPLYLVDAFANEPFQGNPAAICIIDELPEGNAECEAWFQKVAIEMNQAETAFVLAHPRGWNIRWFTPVSEVDLCGHATLAAAHVLWETKRQHRDEPIHFVSRGGPLICKKTAKGITMDFPAEPAEECPAPPELLAGLGAPTIFVGRNRMDYVVLLDSEEAVRSLKPDLARLALVETRGIIVTAKGSGRFDFVSRSFFPRLGVPEDQVCGSAHCCLGPFWQERLAKADFVAYQASRRGGIVHVGCRGERVLLSGRAVTALRGELIV